MKLSGQRITRWIAAVVAVCILVSALGATYTPERLPGILRQSLQIMTNQLGARALLSVTGMIIGIYAFMSLWIRRATTIDDPFPEADPHTVTRDVAIAGKQLTTKFNRQRTENSDATDSNTTALRSELKELIIDLYTHKLETRETARRYVEAGQWTSDQYAAAFVTDSPRIDYPLRHRLYAWLYPGAAYNIRVRRTLSAIESKYAAYDIQYDPPTRTNSHTQHPENASSYIADSQSAESE